MRGITNKRTKSKHFILRNYCTLMRNVNCNKPTLSKHSPAQAINYEAYALNGDAISHLYDRYVYLSFYYQRLHNPEITRRQTIDQFTKKQANIPMSTYNR